MRVTTLAKMALPLVAGTGLPAHVGAGWYGSITALSKCADGDPEGDERTTVRSLPAFPVTLMNSSTASPGETVK